MIIRKDSFTSDRGIPLTTKNYTATWSLLNERFGNEQIFLLSHMNKILNSNPVYSPNVRSLRELYNNVEGNVQSVENLGISSEQFDSLLIPKILEKPPNMIKLQSEVVNGKWEVVNGMFRIF